MYATSFAGFNTRVESWTYLVILMIGQLCIIHGTLWLFISCLILEKQLQYLSKKQL